MTDQLKTQLQGLTKDRKKLATVALLLAVMLLMWGRLLLKHVPQTAVANPSLVVASAGTAGQTSRGDHQPGLRRVVQVDLSTQLARDMFAVNWEFYPQGTTGSDPNQSSGTEKSGPEAVDDSRGEDALRRAADGLQLQTTILGANPRAVISGQVLKPGQKISGMTLLKVLPRQVILEMQGQQVKLEM
jgi:hypothetical protein